LRRKVHLSWCGVYPEPGHQPFLRSPSCGGWLASKRPVISVLITALETKHTESDLISMAFSLYTLLIRLWISFWLESSRLEIHSSLSAQYVRPQHPPLCTDNIF
jgi:hypothetical protein